MAIYFFVKCANTGFGHHITSSTVRACLVSCESLAFLPVTMRTMTDIVIAITECIIHTMAIIEKNDDQ